MGYTEVFQALGGGIAGLLAVTVLALFGLLWATLNSRLKDAKDFISDLKQEKKDLVGKLDPLTNAVERQTSVIEALGRELERRRSTR